MAQQFNTRDTVLTGSPKPPPSQLEIPMESALSPREIQSRVRAGDSVEEVARIAGMSVEWVEPYAGPVIAEREYIAQLAQSHQVRRSGETIPHRSLGQVVQDRLSARGVNLDSLSWDAWRLEGRRWLVQVRYESGKSHREAHFVYDASGRFSLPDNDDALWLLGLHSASHGPQPGRRRREEESEPTVDLNDDIALVRVVQPHADELRDLDTDTDSDNDADDAYSEAELAEINGVYDIVPPPSGMDVLYDMLSGFDEDSVQIYAGLIRDGHRVPPESATAPPAEATEPDQVADRTEPIRTRRGRTAKAVPPAEPEAAPIETEAAQPVTEAPATVDQPSLVDQQSEPEEASAEAKPAPETPRTRRKRAQVPSWDEIMFGSPKNPS